LPDVPALREGGVASVVSADNVVAEQFNDDGSVYIRAYVKPLVNLLWLGGLLFVLGSVVAMWPDAREQRCLAARYSGGGVSRADPGAAVA
jgi:cytochrome c biogenesis factor